MAISFFEIFKVRLTVKIWYDLNLEFLSFLFSIFFLIAMKFHIKVKWLKWFAIS